MDIIRAESPDQVACAASLFREYQQQLGVDLCFQDFDDELAQLPGAYVPPKGTLLLAVDDAGQAFGCVALRPDGSVGQHPVAELKRLYVRPQARQQGIGIQLSRHALQFAVAAGYHRVRLDTLPTMTAALGLYEGLGFRPIGPYRFNPIEGALFMELDLQQLELS